MYVGSGVWYPDEPQVGWKNRLKFYAWTSGGKELAPNWGETNSLIKNFSKELRPLIERIESDEPVSAESLKDIYEKIKEWGNPRGAERSGAQVLAALKKVVSHANGGAAPPVDSTLTKVYAMAWPDEYAIYDTRVAASIVTIAEDLYRRTRLKGFCERFPALGHMDTASISGTRPRGRRLEKNSPEDLVFGGWPNAYKKWPAQLDANRLCLGIQKVLNKRRIGGRTAWSLREVEAVLFMEGY